MTPKQNPALSKDSTAAPPHALPTPPPDAYTSRQPEGSTEDSDADDTGPHAVPAFGRSDNWLREYQEAAADVNRPRIPSEIPDHIPPVIETYDNHTKKKFRDFVDIMYQCSAKPYTTKSKSGRVAINNLALCFLRADLVGLNLASQTRGWFIEDNRLLTVTLPTGYDLLPPFNQNDRAWYLCYHKMDWPTIPKILLDKVARPASWSRDEHGNPVQYPSYDFFGYASQLQSADLSRNAIEICSKNLNKIGKGSYPSGVLTVTRCPVWERL